MIGVENALLLRCHIKYDLKGTQNEICRKPHQFSLVKKVQNKKQCRNANAISTVEGQWREVDCRSAMKMHCRMALTVPCRRAPKVPCRRAPKVPCRRALKVHCRRALNMRCRRAMKVRYVYWLHECINIFKHSLWSVEILSDWCMYNYCRKCLQLIIVASVKH